MRTRYGVKQVMKRTDDDVYFLHEEAERLPFWLYLLSRFGYVPRRYMRVTVADTNSPTLTRVVGKVVRTGGKITPFS